MTADCKACIWSKSRGELSLWVDVREFEELLRGGFSNLKMSLKQAEGMSIAQALAMTVAEIPVFLYSTFGQVSSKWNTEIPSKTIKKRL